MGTKYRAIEMSARLSEAALKTQREVAARKAARSIRCRFHRASHSGDSQAMTPEDLLALIEEVEAFNPATYKGTSINQYNRALADRCLLAFGWTRISEQVMEDAPGVPTYAQPNPVLSRDDATALLKKEWYVVRIEYHSCHQRKWSCECWPLSDKPWRVVSHAHTEPCARTAAALKVKLREIDT